MNIYQITNYRLLLIIPIIIIIFAVSQLPKLKLGTEFTGGTLIVAITDKEVTQKELETTFSNYSGLYSNVYQTPNGFQIELEIKKSEDIEKAEALKNEISILFDNYTNSLLQGNNTQIKFYEETIKQKANELFIMTNYSNNKSVYEMSMSEIDNQVSSAYNFYLNNYYKEIETLLRTNYNISSLSINTITPTLSTRFIEEAKNVALFSGVLAFLIVMLYFRSFVPAFAVIIGALADILIAIGLMAFFNIPLSFASFAALLMLIGFSLDTNILLTVRTLKKKELIPIERAYDALKTGVTMTITSIMSFSLLLIVSNYLRISTYYEIAATAILGLIGDLFATWGINAVIILHYIEEVENKEKKKKLEENKG